MPSRLDWIQQEIDGLKEAGLYNRIRTHQLAAGRLAGGGRQTRAQLLLEQLPGPGQPPAHGQQAARKSLLKYGCGPAAVRTIAGTMDLHLELERRLAAFKGVEAAITFQSGFTANLATIPGPGRQRGRDLLGRAQPRQHHRRQPPVRRAHRALRPLRPGRPGSQDQRKPGQLPPRAGDHRRRVQHGRRCRPAGQDLRGHRGPRCDADGR